MGDSHASCTVPTPLFRFLPSIVACSLLALLTPRPLFSHRYALSSFHIHVLSSFPPIVARSLLPSPCAFFLPSLRTLFLPSYHCVLSSPIAARFLPFIAACSRPSLLSSPALFLHR
ncbi:hypothetical protein AMTR_s00113p00091220 [Amborella trichopoda]|uniref:Uncharacterized protein n=1 Tax=Amborella trichopoda TaxID=13333 RepID=W1NPE0_AMBTC|nr:hypothetical protein AMTR_s00113p00091220 [Amborella trichopoda]